MQVLLLDALLGRGIARNSARRAHREETRLADDIPHMWKRATKGDLTATRHPFEIRGFGPIFLSPSLSRSLCLSCNKANPHRSESRILPAKCNISCLIVALIYLHFPRTCLVAREKDKSTVSRTFIVNN